MMHYRDMTFCTGDGCTKFDTCPRALSPVVQAAARRWWGGDDAPIARYTDPKLLACYTPAPTFFDATDPTIPIEP
jgi:hypothetical protein